MPCPKCEGMLIHEDGVVFCEECLFVVIRENDLARKKPGRPFGALQSTPTKGILWVSKKGNIYRKYKKRANHHKKEIKKNV